MRALLLDSSAPLAARTEALLFAAARAQLVEDVIAPALARGATVIADRFVGSSLVYQGVVRGVGADAVRAINDVGTGGLRARRDGAARPSPRSSRTSGATRTSPIASSASRSSFTAT